jgi:hypothetical protein
MGKPSNARRSARRPGKRERMRVKKRRRHASSHFGAVYQAVLGADCVRVHAGRKKAGKIGSWLADLKHPPTPSSGEPVPGYGVVDRGPVTPERTRRRGTTELQIAGRHRTRTHSRPEGTE